MIATVTNAIPPATYHTIPTILVRAAGIMPLNVAGSVKIHIQEAKDMLDGRGLKWELMLERWDETSPEQLEVELSALMLIEAILNPDLVTEKKLKPPPENAYRDVFVYTWIG